ncbi:hypothetical protein OV320_4288 [Actinobacteria bacterium OV320]|nr:hypothetical protein OV320_4288 [Actinobacteria bacterium OV320]
MRAPAGGTGGGIPAARAVSAARNAARRFVRPGEVLSSALETVVTAGSVLLWYALAMLLYLENQARESWDPDLPREGPVFLLASVAGASLLLSRALRALPAGRTGRLGGVLDRVALARGAAVAVTWVTLVAIAVVT